MDVSELLALYAGGERDFREVNLTVVNLKGVNLRDADLSYADLSGANLNNANLSNVNLSNADLMSADLNFAKLNFAKLSFANLNGANLTNTELRNANLSNANLSNADLSNANLALANFNNAILTGAKLDGTILAYQNIAEQLRQENQTLTERVKLLEEKLEQEKPTQDLNNASNQGINAPHKWNNFNFRSKTEMKIAEALDRTGVLFYPNSKARLNQAELRVNKESDFLVFYKGKFGILEVDGRDYHQIAADDHERDRLFKRHGIKVIERFDATRCWNKPEQVVEEFLEILSQA
jgi:hypothetical protein